MKKERLVSSGYLTVLAAALSMAALTALASCATPRAAAPQAARFPAATIADLGATGQDRTAEAFASWDEQAGPDEDPTDFRFRTCRAAASESALAAECSFNLLTRWEDGAVALAAEQALRSGMNPGLGLRSLHARGVVGKGVGVAIIDQNLAGGHAEFADRLRTYVDLGCGQPADSGSMHGPSVASLLAGRSVGAAPGADLHFFAAPSWAEDAAVFYADALERIIALSAGLSPRERIRVVSVSGAPSGPGSPFRGKGADAWDAAVAKAEAAGMLVLDCTSHHGFVDPGYVDRSAAEDPAKVRAGWPGMEARKLKGGVVAPCSYRTTAEEYVDGEEGYAYWGRGGLSWAIPWVAGSCALAWQVNPDLDGAAMKELLFKTAAANGDGALVVDPVALVAEAERLASR